MIFMETSQVTATPDTSSPDLNVLAQEAQEILRSMLPLLSFEAKLTSSTEGGGVRIKMECEDAGRLIGRRGSTVNEIQFLLNRILQRRHKTVPRIFLDADGPHESNEKVDEHLITRIQGVTDQVRRWGESAELGPMNAHDRKAVQDMFANDQEIEVVSLESREDSTGAQKMRLQLKKKD